MKILASSVIRSTHRGDSHGGLYVIDLEKENFEQVLDWNYPHIRWDGGGGDRGIRGLIFYEDYLYAAGADYLFVFNKNFELIDKYTHHLLDGTHELAIYNDKIYNISNCFDAILIFDLKTKQWINAFQHIKGRRPQFFDPNLHVISRVDTLHLDSITVTKGWIWYSGSTTEYLYGVHEDTHEFVQISLCHINTHNAQFWKDGIVFNRSLESDTTYQIPTAKGHVTEVDWRINQKWPTPQCDRSKMTNAGLPADHARAEYTRGMVLGKDLVVIGTSPASIHAFELGRIESIVSVRLTHDLRNSICGMTEYKC